MEGGDEMKVSEIKGKVAAKVAKGKAKVADKCGKCGKAAKACAVIALLVALVGCHMGEQPTAQRAQTSTIRDNVFNITVVMPTNAVAENAERPALHVEVGNQAQANETSGTETMTASPSNTPTVSTPVQVDARYNDPAKSAADSVGSIAGAVTAGSALVKDVVDGNSSSTNSATAK